MSEQKPVVPILVVCHNNGRYVQNTVLQIQRLNPEYAKNIMIVDNASTDQETCEYLKTQPKVVYEPNEGPWVDKTHHTTLYESLPDMFVLTDPDLQFHPELPRDFIDQLCVISSKYQAQKVGFALDISEPNEMFPGPYQSNVDIVGWETPFWKKKLPDETYPLFEAPIDTTFCVVSKLHPWACIRVAGKFTAKHLPWYKHNPLYFTTRAI